MNGTAIDQRWMGAALTLATRGRGQTWPNPSVGCVIVKQECVIGRGWTQAGGRPHAEAMALAEAGAAARGATLYVTLEPCAHHSERGPDCSGLIAASGVARVVVALEDPDPRTAGKGLTRLRDAGIDVTIGPAAIEARRSMAGFLMRQREGRPHVTLKLALSLDGCIAMADGRSRWITGDRARAHGHLERAQSDAILVGRGTYDADSPRLDVRLAGLEARSPERVLLTHGGAPAGWIGLPSPEAIAGLEADWLLVEGGAGAASAFLKADLVDRLSLYRAPIIIGHGRASLGEIGLAGLAEAHGRWRLADRRTLGVDVLEAYERVRE